MVTRMGHMALRVPDLDAAVDFQRAVVGLVETERTAGAAYLTCNERHHELVLVQDPVRRGYDHIGLEVPDAPALERAKRAVVSAGGRLLGDVYDGEPGIDRALRVQAPGGHVFKLFCGMEAGPALGPGERPLKFEHASVKVRNPRAFERFLADGLGFRFSDRMGLLASWWHCDADHHAGFPIVPPDSGRPLWAMRPDRKLDVQPEAQRRGQADERQSGEHVGAQADEAPRGAPELQAGQ